MAAELSIASGQLLTIAEYAALGETDPGYTELVEGRLLRSPTPGPDHQVALAELGAQIGRQLPPDLLVVHALDVDLELAPADAPGFSRRPDLIIFDRTALDRVAAEGGIVHASEVRIVIEIIAAGSRRIDSIDKRREYADAGIPYYWIVDLDEPVSITACHLAREGEQRVTGTFTATEPFPVTIDLDRLV